MLIWVKSELEPTTMLIMLIRADIAPVQITRSSQWALMDCLRRGREKNLWGFGSLTLGLIAVVIVFSMVTLFPPINRRSIAPTRTFSLRSNGCDRMPIRQRVL